VAAAIPRATQSSSQVSGIDGALLEAESKIEQASVPEVVHDFLPFQWVAKHWEFELYH
jgi:hypothetical protein